MSERSTPAPRKRKSARERPNRKGAPPSNRAKPKRSAEPEPDGAAEELVYGRRTVLATLESERPLNRIWIAPRLRYSAPFHALLDQAKGRGAAIEEVPPHRLDRIVKGGNHQGVAAQVSPYAYCDLAVLTERALARRDRATLVVCDGITDPHNLGAIARSAEAFGAAGLVLPKRRASAITATAMKVAAGALERISVARVANIARTLDQLKASGFWIYGTAEGGRHSLEQAEFDRPIALAIGSEAQGLSLLVQRRCDVLVSVPLIGQTASLNASAAAAVALYEIERQRRARRPIIDAAGGSSA
jgi:23S rRNA (guanosine2251-2'-O)-methyltransferase